MGVLWATHLIDEAGPDDDVVILHKGCVRDRGRVAVRLAQHGARDLGELFAGLTRQGETGDAA